MKGRGASGMDLGTVSPQVLSEQLLKLYSAGQFKEAQTLCRRILEKQPDHFQALHVLGAIHAKRGEFQQALAFIEQALKVDGTSALAWNGHGSALRALGRYDEALVSYNKAIALKPDFAQAFCNQGAMMQELGRLDEALPRYDQAIALAPHYVRALAARAEVLLHLRRFSEALAACDRVVALEPTHAEVFRNRGLALQKLHRPEEALESYQRAIALDPDHAPAIGLAVIAANQLFAWANRKRWQKDLLRLLRAGKPVDPFPLLHLVDSPASLLEAGAHQWRPYKNVEALKRPERTGREDGRLRLAYLSSDFRHHPVAYTIVELLERHDRAAFEVWAISFHPSDDSAIRKRLEGAVDRFIDVEKKTDEEVARLLADNHIDIVIDLTGHTEGYRHGIFARRPAPIAVNYLGYPATSGSDYIDYILADTHVIPQDSKCFYSEKVVYLPDSYFVCDSKRAIAEPPPSRSALGLPEQAFVFCAFHNPYKISPALLSVWARLLKAVETSVLWVNLVNPTAIRNLTGELQARGVGPEKLVPVPFVKDMADHLSRLRLADLFLDAMPYNAHSTACDLLYAGVPLVTCAGESFASRVGESLLHAAGVPELATRSIEDYEGLALKLAIDPPLLQAIRDRLARNRTGCALFDTDRTRRHIEAAYKMMWDTHRRGLPPRSFSVQPLT